MMSRHQLEAIYTVSHNDMWSAHCFRQSAGVLGYFRPLFPMLLIIVYITSSLLGSLYSLKPYASWLVSQLVSWIYPYRVPTDIVSYINLAYMAVLSSLSSTFHLLSLLIHQLLLLSTVCLLSLSTVLPPSTLHPP